ncbi:MAG: hypothetical protein QW348_04690 [Ignisphaera sp.]
MDFRELFDLIASAFVVFVIFSLPYINPPNYEMLVSYLLATATAFVFHELAHRAVARSKGVFAVYRAWYLGLLISLVLAIATRGTFVFIAPGAVEIYMPIYLPSIESSIAIAGPTTNVVISLLCIPLSMVPRISVYARVVGYVNSSLALFNLLPIPPLDGYKVFRYDVVRWGLAMILSIVSFIIYILFI